jgi:host factor-I protein
MPSKSLSLQDHFLNNLRRSKTPVTIFLVKGVKLSGVITWFDAFSLLLRREGVSQLIYKHAMSTIMPSERATLQDRFLAASIRQRMGMTVFLVNGVMLQGEVVAFNRFSMLLGRGDQVQLVYKHAVSTMQPASQLHLGESDAPEDDAAEDRGEAA